MRHEEVCLSQLVELLRGQGCTCELYFALRACLSVVTFDRCMGLMPGVVGSVYGSES